MTGPCMHYARLLRMREMKCGGLFVYTALERATS